MSAILDALGFAGDAFDRPGAAVRGLLAGRPDQLGYLVPGAESMGLVNPDRRVTGKGLLQHAGLLGEDDDSPGGTLGGMAVDVATNPLTYLPLLGAAGGAGKGLSPMLRARRGFGVARGASRPAGVGEDILGNYDAATKTANVFAGSGPSVARHEAVHGLVDAAATSGDASGLPFMVRLAARSRPADPAASPFRAGLSDILDELAAQTLEHKGWWGQAKGGAQFIFGNPLNPLDEARAGYAGVFDQSSPLAGALFRGVGYAPSAAAGAGVAGAAGYAISRQAAREASR